MICGGARVVLKWLIALPLIPVVGAYISTLPAGVQPAVRVPMTVAIPLPLHCSSGPEVIAARRWPLDMSGKAAGVAPKRTRCAMRASS